ncbi:MAG TPA: aminotransferase class IV [Bacteroidia bacterium]|jgi:branched-subunit amino acid aminotransferase/4-amino-4-deoxychorismate lyase|nr:aminotransferase class IV [Bacteroidia bacterium]
MTELSINYNGTIRKASEPVFYTTNRAFRYGDGLFESIRVAQGKVRFLERHLNRLRDSMILLKMDVPEFFGVPFFEEKINALLQTNKIAEGGRVRLTVFRDEGGLYNPETNHVSWLLEATPMTDNLYTLNENGLVVDLYNEFKKPLNRMSCIKSNNALVYVMAGIFKNENKLDDCILLNERFNITEAISSNLFAAKNGVLYTAPIAEGCLDGVMRSEIINIARENRIAVYEVTMAMNVMLNSDEIFLTNAIRGIQWVGTYRAKRYTNKMAEKLVALLNAKL